MKRSLIVLCLLLTACAADGTLATTGKPVDKTATLKATCDGITKADIAFQAFAKARPGVIDANGMAVEGAVLATMKPICTAPYSGDIDAATNAAITALIQVSTLLATWQT